MGPELTVAAALAGVNILLLVGLGTIWLRNYWTFRTTLVLGLVAFVVVLLLRNVAALYFFFSMDMLYVADPGVHTVVLVLHGLETVALVILAYVTWK